MPIQGPWQYPYDPEDTGYAEAAQALLHIHVARAPENEKGRHLVREEKDIALGPRRDKRRKGRVIPGQMGELDDKRAHQRRLPDGARGDEVDQRRSRW